MSNKVRVGEFEFTAMPIPKGKKGRPSKVLGEVRAADEALTKLGAESALMLSDVRRTWSTTRNKAAQANNIPVRFRQRVTGKDTCDVYVERHNWEDQ